jgi:site-specific DNA recombinase
LVRNEAIDVIVCYSLDRLSRDPVHGVIITQELEKHGVALEAVTESVDSTEIGKLITYIRGFASKLEAEKIRERTMRGKQACLKQGRLPQGTGIGIYGYTWDKEAKKRKVNQFEAAIVGEIFKRAAQGDSLLSISKTLNDNGVPSKGKKLWHTLTIRRMIRNTVYIGQTHYKDTMLPDISPAIVTEDMFQAANAQLDKPKLRTGKAKNEYLLRNHIFCAVCQRPMVGHCLNRKYRYYQCSNARPYENQTTKCQWRYVRANDTEEIVWAKVKEVLSNPDIILKQLTEASEAGELSTIEAEIKELERTLRAYEHRRSNLLKAMELGEFDSDEVLDRLNNLKHARAEDEARLNILVKARDNLTGLANATIKLNQIYDQVLTNLDNCDNETKRLALDALDIKVYAGADKLEIRGVLPLELYLPTIAQTSA